MGDVNFNRTNRANNEWTRIKNWTWTWKIMTWHIPVLSFGGCRVGCSCHAHHTQQHTLYNIFCKKKCWTYVHLFVWLVCHAWLSVINLFFTHWPNTIQPFVPSAWWVCQMPNKHTRRSPTTICYFVFIETNNFISVFPFLHFILTHCQWYYVMFSASYFNHFLCVVLISNYTYFHFWPYY